MQSTSIRYKLFLLALSPLAVGHVLYRACKDGGWKYLKQRLGFGLANYDSRPIHFHCASVGEFITAKPLILAIQSKHPGNKIIISTNTPTAAELVNKLNDKNISHHYLPIDLSCATKRFINKIQPLCTLILETEIWPSYYAAAAKQDIPIVIVNARLSSKTIDANALIREEYRRTLVNVTSILARSEEDYEKYLALGAAAAKTQVIGNLKYAISDTEPMQLACTTIKRPFFFAASTHEDEELRLSEHIELLKRKNFLLILAPRYPDRCKSLASQLEKKGFNVVLRSSENKVTEHADVYIVDTLGELNTFFNEAALVFVGGSMIARGGHNVLEPANFGKCILVGPHTENFALEVEELKNADALIQVNNNHELGTILVKLLKNDLQREQFGKNATLFMEQHTNILNAYLTQIDKFVNTSLH